MYKKWWVYTDSHVAWPSDTRIWRTVVGWQEKACCTKPKKRRCSFALISPRTWRPGHWRRTADPITVLSRYHSGITYRLWRTPISIRYRPRRYWGGCSSPLRSSGNGQRAASTSRFTSFTATCGPQFLLCRKLTTPTPLPQLQHVCAPVGAQQTTPQHRPLHKGVGKEVAEAGRVGIPSRGLDLLSGIRSYPWDGDLLSLPGTDILTATGDDWLAVVGNLQKARQMWVNISQVLRREDLYTWT